MRGLSKLALLTCLTPCLLACAQPGSTTNGVVAGSRSGSYGPESAAQMESRARAGDRYAQALVENHFREIGNAALYRQWMEEGVSREDPAAMQRLASHLISLGGTENCHRAEVMLVRARTLVTDGDAPFLGALDSTMRRLKGELPGSTPCKAAGEH
ncbi:hypothetical protein [Stenotrophomonas maltophilia]|uniref:hypothetical protein n=1 Tax=Stenotrophomonas maltophilia TaxID=40324 RepID=UPI0025EAAA24|nr:hypothetical protein [uncultured Stenotrophomonas sp.]